METALTKGKLEARRGGKRCSVCGQRFSGDAAFCPFDGTTLEASPFDPLGDPLVGSLVDGRYEVQSVLGEGGMGRIYEVRHKALDRAFAMKVLRPDLAEDAELAERFILEAKATASVKHPNVVQITDFGHLPDQVPFFVMELLVGHTLGEVIKAAGPIPPARAARIVRKIAGALAAAHAAGVVHRDLKPDNVFLLAGSRDLRPPGDPDRARSLAMLGHGADVRVVDFGAAKIVGSSRVTREGVVFGTPHYMAPEQASGQPVDARADVYSLGVIMYEMFTGRVPFEADTYMGVLTQHMFVRPALPSTLIETSDALGALEPITMTCLEKKPDDRFASMDHLIRALDDVVLAASDPPPDFPGRRRSDPTQLAPGALGPSPVPFLRTARDSSVPPLPPKAPPLRWAVVAAVVASIAATMAAARWAVSRDRHEEGPAPLSVRASAAPPAPVAAPPAAIAAPSATPREAPAAAVPSAGSPAVPDVGEGVPSAGKAAASRARHAPSSEAAAPSPALVDDVGDPFTKH